MSEWVPNVQPLREEQPPEPLPPLDPFVKKIKDITDALAALRARADAAEATRKTLLEEFFENIKDPRELMGRAVWLAEQLSLPQSIILKWLGQQINRGDWTINNTDGEKIGVLYLGDIFAVGQKGEWEAVDSSTVVWHISEMPAT